ncbi:hypothetical protein BDZ85DRAFT_260444 [Elsinoe ampelina]|uniref:Uncharacterized protein n=1 Tax=Elsinoe ampelina TaxID=302913 RepID=A0A6A6GEK9_9PEZI|nr:hypothetical protein BDZ85DRAFT_260444 [Elsinoe ampelina]
MNAWTHSCGVLSRPYRKYLKTSSPPYFSSILGHAFMHMYQCCVSICIFSWLLKELQSTAQDQTTYDQETTQFEKVGLCRDFQTKSWLGRSLETCNVYCKKPEAERAITDCGRACNLRRRRKRQDDKPVGKLGAAGVSCMGDTTGNAALSKAPDGSMFKMGKCECSAPAIAKIIAEEVLKALPMLDNILCQVTTQALSMVADLASVVLPGGVAVKGVATVVKAAKTFVQNGDSVVGMTSWFGDMCNPDNDPEVAAVLAQGDKWFDPLSVASSKIAEGAGCVVSEDKCKDLPPEEPPPKDVTPANDNDPSHPQPTAADTTTATDKTLDLKEGDQLAKSPGAAAPTQSQPVGSNAKPQPETGGRTAPTEQSKQGADQSPPTTGAEEQQLPPPQRQETMQMHTESGGQQTEQDYYSESSQEQQTTNPPGTGGYLTTNEMGPSDTYTPSSNALETY